MAMVAGVDACRAGWVVALVDDWPPGASVVLEVVADFEAVLDVAAEAEFVAVDMPIGLPDGGARGDYPRTCDLEARRLLGPRAAAQVFLTPPRATLAARDPYEFQELHRRVTGKGAGLPLWGLVPKIKQVDALVSPGDQQRVFEFHPELVFMRFCNGPLPSKHTAPGIARRLEVLAEAGLYASRLDDLGKLAGCKIDDVLDALAGAIVAALRGRDPREARRLPEAGKERDSSGLAMEIWY